MFFFRLYGITDRADVDYILETFQTETGGLKHNEIKELWRYREKSHSYSTAFECALQWFCDVVSTREGSMLANLRLGTGARPRMYNIVYMWRRGMKIMSMSESRANYAATLDSVINDQEEVVITRPGGENVVMLPQREYESMKETLYLMASPANRRRISRSIEQLNSGGGQQRELIDSGEDDG